MHHRPPRRWTRPIVRPLRRETAIQSGQAAYFMTAHDLVTDLGRAYREGRLDRRLRIYLAPKVLIID